MTGAEILVRALESEGVTTVFGYPGAAICPVYDALAVSCVRHVLVRAEQNAGHAASGYSRAGDGVGVCLATSGPGATNLITALATAYADSVPLLAITGQVPRDQLGRDVFQEVDITGAVAPFIKHSYLVDAAASLPQLVRNALHIASTGRPGPVLLDIPLDVQLAEADYVPAEKPALRGYKPTVRGHAVQVARAAELIGRAARPLLVAGGGVFAAKAVSRFRDFARANAIPTVHTMMGKGVMPAGDPLCLGMVGTFGMSAANRALAAADVIVLVGARVGDRAVATPDVLGRRAAIVHIDVDPAEIGKNVSTAIPIVGDAGNVLAQLLAKTEPPDTEAWRAEVAAWPEPAPEQRSETPGRCDPRAFITALSAALDERAVYCADVGRNQIWSARYHTVRQGKFLTSCGMGTMGYALPCAIGARLAAPDRQVVAVCGDGAFQMCMPELATVVREGLPVKLAVLRDRRLGMIADLQDAHYGGRRFAVDLGDTPDLALIARAYGVPYARVAGDGGIADGVAEMLADPDAPFLLEVEC